MQAVSNLCFRPQGRQGPERSDIRLRASAGLIEWYVSVSGLSCHSHFYFLSPYISLFLSPLPQSPPRVLLSSQPFFHFFDPSVSLPSHHYTPLLSATLWFKQLPSVSRKMDCDFIFIPEWQVNWVKMNGALFLSQDNREAGEKFISAASERTLQYASVSQCWQPTQRCNSCWWKVPVWTLSQSNLSGEI